MKVLVCYTSKHGATEKYMQWLAETLHADLKRFDEIDRKYDFSDYDTVVVSSGTYASFMALNKFLKHHWKELQRKRVVVVAVGASPAEDPWSHKSYNRIPDHIRDGISYIKIMGETPEKARPDDYQSPVVRENLDAVISLIKQTSSN